MADTVKVPWEQDDAGEFDPEAAKRYLSALHADKEKLQTRLKDAQSKSKSGSGEAEALRKENLKLQVQMQTGLNDSQIKRLVGGTFEELMEDAEEFASETNVELRSFFGDPDAEGTPGEDPDGAQEPQEPKDFGRNFRAPGQDQPIPDTIDYDKEAARLDI